VPWPLAGSSAGPAHLAALHSGWHACLSPQRSSPGMQQYEGYREHCKCGYTYRRECGHKHATGQPVTKQHWPVAVASVCASPHNAQNAPVWSLGDSNSGAKARVSSVDSVIGALRTRPQREQSSNPLRAQGPLPRHAFTAKADEADCKHTMHGMCSCLHKLHGSARCCSLPGVALHQEDMPVDFTTSSAVSPPTPSP
jgi:hypothetical protein